MSVKFVAADLGMSVIDLVIQTDASLTRLKLENEGRDVVEQLRQALNAIELPLAPGTVLGVTGGRYRSLPEVVDGIRVRKVDEMAAMGLGGLALAGLDEGLVVSAGTGTAMVAARKDDVHHVTGSAVGGGTLLGLLKLIIGTGDVREIDRLAMAGDASAVDIMLSEAVGGEVGRLPATANAVNLGKLDRENGFTKENLAAGLVRLAAQVIAVIAINAANAENLTEILMIGHLMDLKSIRREINLVGEFYNRDFTIPENPGFGTAMGVLEILKAG